MTVIAPGLKGRWGLMMYGPSLGFNDDSIHVKGKKKMPLVMLIWMARTTWCPEGTKLQSKVTWGHLTHTPNPPSGKKQARLLQRALGGQEARPSSYRTSPSGMIGGTLDQVLTSALEPCCSLPWVPRAVCWLCVPETWTWFSHYG